jgi:hypothetical protein
VNEPGVYGVMLERSAKLLQTPLGRAERIGDATCGTNSAKYTREAGVGRKLEVPGSRQG